MPAKKTTRIEGQGAKQFNRKRNALPTKPVGDGRCQLIKIPPKPRGRLSERLGLACQGKCQRGKTCKISAIIINGRFVIKCVCR